GRSEADRPCDGQGRKPVRALRALRRALPDRSVGHAEIEAGRAVRARRGRDSDGGAVSQDRINDFVVKLANVNGTGSASANSLLMKAIFRMGVPVSGKNFFPSN